MGREKISMVRKATLVAGLSGATLLGGEVIENNNDVETSVVSDLADDLGRFGLLASGVMYAKALGNRLAANLWQERLRDWQEIAQGLPKLENPVSPLRIHDRLYAAETPTRQNRRSYDITDDLRFSFFTTTQAAKEGKPEGSYLACWALKEDVSRMVDRLAGTYGVGRNDVDVAYQAHNMAWFLDAVAPIADDCSKTRQTEGQGKYWFDYIQQQAFAKANLPLPGVEV